MLSVRLGSALVGAVLVFTACGDSAAVTTIGGTDAVVEEPTQPGSTQPEDTSPSATAPATTTAGEDGGTTVPDRSDRTLPEKTPETVPPAPSPVVGEVPAQFLQPVLADAASRTGVAAGDIAVLRAQAVEWNDGSLGCPQPGQVYTQAIVPGYWVVVDAGGDMLDYRLNDRGFFALCEGPSLPPPTGAPSS